MSIRLPQDEDLIELAYNLDIELTSEEIEEFQVGLLEHQDGVQLADHMHPWHCLLDFSDP